MRAEVPERPWATNRIGPGQADRLKNGYQGLMAGLGSEFYSPFVGGPGSGGYQQIAQPTQCSDCHQSIV